ncbi:PE family protein, partial [Mycobacterium helveticum]
MSRVFVMPGALTAAAANVATINASLDAANAAAGLPFVWVPGSSGDQVSKALATLFSEVGQEFQTLVKEAATVSAQIAQALHQAEVALLGADVLALQVLTPSTWPAAVAEASGSSPPPRTDPLATVMYELNQTGDKLFGQPLFYDGANGTSQSSPNGQNGGLLMGNGGAGWNSTVAGVNGGNGGMAGILGNGGAGGTGGPGAVGVAPGIGGNGGAAVWQGNGGAGGAGWNSTISGVNGGNGGVGG